MKRKYLIKSKRILSIVLAGAICLSGAACGRDDTEVIDYGSNSTSESDTDTATSSDISYRKQDGTLQDLYGDRIDWEDEFVVDGVDFKVDTYKNIPDMQGMNVYRGKYADDGKDKEDAIVKALFGDSAKKIEEFKYKNATDYYPFMYKYREIMWEHAYHHNGDDTKEVHFDVNNKDYSLFDGSSDVTFKWTDSDDLYIHMYEGEYNDCRFGLLLAYDYGYQCRYIFFEPISIKEYFPEDDFQSMIIKTSNDTAGNPMDMDNRCGDSIDDLKMDADSLIREVFDIPEGVEVTDDSYIYKYCDNQNLAHFVEASPVNSSQNGGGTSVLCFSTGNYMTSLKNSGFEGDLVDYSILAEQEDIYSEYNAEHPVDIYDYVGDFITNGMNPIKTYNFTCDGYAAYLQDGFLDYDLLNPYFSDNNNFGEVKYTSKGLYSVDLQLFTEYSEVVENVSLQDFDTIKESLKSELTNSEKFDLDKMKTTVEGHTSTITIETFGLSYYSGLKDSSGDGISCIPVWYVQLCVEDDGLKIASVYINAMDGTIVDADYFF